MDPQIGAALITGGSGLLGSTLNSIFGSSYDDSLALMQQQYNFQRQMAAQQQQYWKDQFNMINEYNDPSNAAKRYLRAGISPSAAFGGSTVGQSSASTQVGQGGSPVPYPPTMQNGMQMFATLAQALSSLGSAFKNSAEGRSIASMLGEQVRGLKLSNDQLQFRFGLEKVNLPKKQKLEIGKLNADILNLQSQISLAGEQELKTIEERFKIIAERQNELVKGSILQQHNDTFMRDFQSQIDLRRSQIAANQGNARESNARAYSTEYINSLWDTPSVRDSKLKELEQAGDKAVADKELTQTKRDDLKEAITNARNANEKWQFTYWFDKAMRLVDTSGRFIKNISK